MTPHSKIDLGRVSVVDATLGDDEEDFVSLTTSLLPRYYADVDATFAQSIVDTHRLGYDPVGHFTKRKRLCRVLYAGQRIGYTVITEKRGFSVKIGPTVLYDDWRSQGVGTRLRWLLREEYATLGIRKAYSTVADNKLDSYRYLVKSGYVVEAHLVRQYSAGHGELVFGQFYQPSTFSLAPEIMLRGHQDCTILGTSRDCRGEVAPFLLNRMADSFSEIDQTFLEALFRAEERGQGRFADKGKKLFVAIAGDRVVGVAVTTAKRGGAVKIAPLLADAASTIAQLVDAAERFYYNEHNSRKLYVLMPAHHRAATRVLVEAGCVCEGLLREPYKRGIDVRIMSRHRESSVDQNGARDIVLSILPDPAERILSRRKAFEIRKSIPQGPVRGAFLFATAQTQAFVGYVELKGFFRLPKEELWNIVGETAAPRARFFDYLRDCTVAYALAISRVCVFSHQIQLQSVRTIDPTFATPRQFFYLNSSSTLAQSLVSAVNSGEWFDSRAEAIIAAYPSQFSHFS